MGFVERCIRWFGSSKTGHGIDLFCVRYFYFSPIIYVFTRSEKAGYNKPGIFKTYGRKTGALRQVVLPTFPHSDGGSMLIVGSRGGTPIDPHWAKNLKARPAALVEMRGETFAADVSLLEGEERAREFERLCELSPVYARYQQAAKKYRELPVFRVVRSEGRVLSQCGGRDCA